MGHQAQLESIIMSYKKNMSPEFLDVFKEIGNIGAGNATTALSVMLGRRIDMKVPIARLVPFQNVSDILGGPETVVVGVMVNMSRDLHGYILLVLGLKDGMSLATLLTGNPLPTLDPYDVTIPQLDEMDVSALTEIANILIGSYLGAISTLTGLRIDATVPELVIDMAGAIMSVPAIEYGKIGDEVLMLGTDFSNDQLDIFGHFFLIPDMESYHVLLRSLGMLQE